jgi:tetratricopeptide (TPR) repeat protein
MRALIIVTCLCLLADTSFSQQSFGTWEAESKTNKRMLPRYGHLPKSASEIQADSDYVKKMMELPQFKTRREASNHMIDLGFQYYYRSDFKTAMYRFNQAYLLDSANTDIFWGYGAIYSAMGQLQLAKEQYDIGLSMDPDNTHLITDLATFFMQQSYLVRDMPKNDFVKDPKAMAKEYMDSAIHHLNRSYKLDPENVHTAFKLSVCYYNNNDCENAWKYYDAAMALGGKPVTEEYTRDLKRRCKRN